MAIFYIEQEWPAHALQAAKRAFSDRNLTAEERTSLKEINEEAMAIIQQFASGFGLSIESMQRACYINEEAQKPTFHLDMTAEERSISSDTGHIGRKRRPKELRLLLAP